MGVYSRNTYVLTHHLHCFKAFQNQQSKKKTQSHQQLYCGHNLPLNYSDDLSFLQVSVNWNVRFLELPFLQLFRTKHALVFSTDTNGLEDTRSLFRCLLGSALTCKHFCNSFALLAGRTQKEQPRREELKVASQQLRYRPR